MARLMWNIHYYSVSIRANYSLSYIVWSLPLIRTYALFAVIDFFYNSVNIYSGTQTHTHTQPPSLVHSFVAIAVAAAVAIVIAVAVNIAGAKFVETE